VVDAVLNLPAIAVVLSLHARGVVAALGHSCLVDAANRVGTCVFGGNDLLTAISQPLFIPNDGLKEPLQRSGSDLLIQRDCFRVLSLHV